MSWVRISDDFNEHPKLAAVGPLAWGVWAASLAYCNRNLTDGFLPRATAKSLGCFEIVDAEGRIWTLGRTSGYEGEDIDHDWIIGILVDAGIWERVDGGYRVHNYLHYQPSADEVLAQRLDQHTQKVLAGKQRAAGASRDDKGRLVSTTTTSETSSTSPANPPAPVQPQPQPQPLKNKKRSASPAQELIRQWSEAETPPRRVNWASATKIVQGFIDAGWEPSTLSAALASVSAISNGWIERALEPYREHAAVEYRGVNNGDRSVWEVPDDDSAE